VAAPAPTARELRTGYEIQVDLVKHQPARAQDRPPGSVAVKYCGTMLHPPEVIFQSIKRRHRTTPPPPASHAGEISNLEGIRTRLLE
jgi:hypothetical protein